MRLASSWTLGAAAAPSSALAILRAGIPEQQSHVGGGLEEAVPQSHAGEKEKKGKGLAWLGEWPAGLGQRMFTAPISPRGELALLAGVALLLLQQQRGVGGGHP